MIWTDNDDDIPMLDQEDGRYLLLTASLQHVVGVLFKLIAETFFDFCMIWTDYDDDLPLVDQENGRYLLLTTSLQHVVIVLFKFVAEFFLIFV